MRHGIGGVTGGLRGRFAPLVGVAEEGVLDVEVALVRRDLHRLAHAAAGEVDRRRHVGELDEVVQVLERAVAPAALEVGHERRAAHRGEDGCIAAEAHVARGVAGEELELLGRGREQPPRHAARDVDALAGHVRPGLFPQAQRLRVAPELDPHLLEDGLGIGLDDLDRFRAQQLHRFELAADVGVLGGRTPGACAPGVAAAAAAAQRSHCLAHQRGLAGVPYRQRQQ